mgnify:CR=1 FL=1
MVGPGWSEPLRAWPEALSIDGAWFRRRGPFDRGPGTADGADGGGPAKSRPAARPRPSAWHPIGAVCGYVDTYRGLGPFELPHGRWTLQYVAYCSPFTDRTACPAPESQFYAAIGFDSAPGRPNPKPAIIVDRLAQAIPRLRALLAAHRRTYHRGRRPSITAFLPADMERLRAGAP